MSQFYFFGIQSTWQVTQTFGKLLNLSKSIQSKMIQRIQWMIQHNKCLEFPLSHTVKFKVDRHLRRTKKLNNCWKMTHFCDLWYSFTKKWLDSINLWCRISSNTIDFTKSPFRLDNPLSNKVKSYCFH